MCGIIGINSNKPVSATIINSLKKLEYRGYDSAGIATLSSGLINEIKSEGRVDIVSWTGFCDQYDPNGCCNVLHPGSLSLPLSLSLLFFFDNVSSTCSGSVVFIPVEISLNAVILTDFVFTELSFY